MRRSRILACHNVTEMPRRPRPRSLPLAALLALFLAAPAAGQQYPTRSIRMVVGFAAGGATDISARTLAQKLSETVGQQVVVDNRPGASGNVAGDIVARAPADGHTVLLANATVAMPTLFAKVPFDVQKDLKAVSLVGYGPLALTAHPSLPVRSVKELVALAKRRPGELNYASAGSGLNRSAALPEVPSGAEAGVAGYDATSWYGMFVPARTPQAVVARLGEQAVKALADRELKERLFAQGIEPATGGVEQFETYLAAEIPKWARVIKTAAIPPQ